MNNFYCSFVSIHYIICECGDTFPTEEGLQLHLESEHKTPSIERNEYQCSTCDKIFPTEKLCLIHLQVHSRNVRAKREPKNPSPNKKRYFTCKNIVCEVCGKRYASNAALRYHQRVHTGERPYQCTMCPKTFTMPLFLQIHIRTHTGERPYECPLCPKAFSNKAALLRHDRVHTGIKPYECPQCGKFFTQSNSMKLHVKTVHLKMPTPYKSKNRRAKQALRRSNIAMHGHPERVRGPVKEYDPRDKVEVKIETNEDSVQQLEYEDCDVDGDGDVYHEVYQDHDQEQAEYENIKVEVSEIPMYEEDVEQSDVIYEEVYEMEEI